MDAICRGSWLLGSACGKCDRCREEAVSRMPDLLAKAKKLDEVTLIMRAAHQGSREFAGACVEEIHRVLIEGR
jgi:hypothetical protein